MELNNFFGVPAHPLLVHLPVVGIPVLMLMTVAMIARPRWRERLVVPTAALGVLIAGATVLAASAGESLQERVVNTSLVREHAELGDQLKVIVLGYVGLLVAYAVIRELRSRNVGPSLTRAMPPLLVTCLVAGALATVWDVRAGHAGAKAAWQDTPTEASGHR